MTDARRSSRRLGFFVAALLLGLLAGVAASVPLWTESGRLTARRWGWRLEKQLGVDRAPRHETPVPPPPPPKTDEELLEPYQPPPLIAPQVTYLQGNYAYLPRYVAFQPFSFFRQHYADDPRGTMRRQIAEEAWLEQWHFNATPGSQMQIVEIEGLQSMRVVPEKNVAESWRVNLMGQNVRIREGDRLTIRLRARAERERRVELQWQDVSGQCPLTDLHYVVLGTELADVEWTCDPLPRATITAPLIRMAEDDAAVELSNVQALDDQGRALFHLPPPYFIEYRMNSRGFLDDEWTEAPALGVARVACLGDSFTFGSGVWPGEAFPTQLEQQLASRGLACETMNFGVPGSSPDQEVAKFSELVLGFQPRAVVLTLCQNDHMTRVEEDQIKREVSVMSLEFLERVAAHRDQFGYAKCLESIGALHELCWQQGVALVVGVFQVERADDWIEVDDAVSRYCREHDIPYVNPADMLVAEGVFGKAAMVAGDFDPHPVPAAHATYARLLADVLESKLVGQGSR